MQTVTFPWVDKRWYCFAKFWWLYDSNHWALMCVHNHCICDHSSPDMYQDRTLRWVTRDHSERTFLGFLITINLHALRISGIPFQKKNSIIISQTMFTFLNGGLVNLLSFTFCKMIHLLTWNRCGRRPWKQEFLQLILCGGFEQQVSTWKLVHLFFLKAWASSDFDRCFANIHGALEGTLDSCFLYLAWWRY